MRTLTKLEDELGPDNEIRIIWFDDLQTYEATLGLSFNCIFTPKISGEGNTLYEALTALANQLDKDLAKP